MILVSIAAIFVQRFFVCIAFDVTVFVLGSPQISLLVIFFKYALVAESYLQV